MLNSIKKLIPPLVLLLVLGGGYYFWNRTQTSDLPTGFASGNGRIEATEVDISALTGGRIAEITAAEGDFVKAGDMLDVRRNSKVQIQYRVDHSCAHDRLGKIARVSPSHGDPNAICRRNSLRISFQPLIIV